MTVTDMNASTEDDGVMGESHKFHYQTSHAYYPPELAIFSKRNAPPPDCRLPRCSPCAPLGGVWVWCFFNEF